MPETGSGASWAGPQPIGLLLGRRGVGEVAVGEEGVEFGSAETGVAELLPGLFLCHPQLARGVDEAF